MSKLPRMPLFVTPHTGDQLTPKDSKGCQRAAHVREAVERKAAERKGAERRGAERKEGEKKAAEWEAKEKAVLEMEREAWGREGAEKKVMEI